TLAAVTPPPPPAPVEAIVPAPEAPAPVPVAAEPVAAEPEPEVPEPVAEPEPEPAVASTPAAVAAAVQEGALPRRSAGSHLPDTGPARDTTAPAPTRTPEDVRAALTSFQHGVARGTLERGDSHPEDAS